MMPGVATCSGSVVRLWGLTPRGPESGPMIWTSASAQLLAVPGRSAVVGLVVAVVAAWIGARRGSALVVLLVRHLELDALLVDQVVLVVAVRVRWCSCHRPLPRARPAEDEPSGSNAQGKATPQ